MHSPLDISPLAPLISFQFNLRTRKITDGGLLLFFATSVQLMVSLMKHWEYRLRFPLAAKSRLITSNMKNCQFLTSIENLEEVFCLSVNWCSIKESRNQFFYVILPLFSWLMALNYHFFADSAFKVYQEVFFIRNIFLRNYANKLVARTLLRKHRQSIDEA